METPVERDIWLGSTLGGVSVGVLVWLLVIGSVPNSWFRKNSVGVAEWMGPRVLKRFLLEPFVMSVYWTNKTMLAHNLYFLVLVGLIFGTVVAAITIYTIRKLKTDRN